MSNGFAPFFGRDSCDAPGLPVTGRSCLIEGCDQANEDVIPRRFGDRKVKRPVPLYPILIVTDLGGPAHAGLDIQEVGFTGFSRVRKWSVDSGHSSSIRKRI